MNIKRSKKFKEAKYESFSRFLLQKIEAGVYKPGDKLPAERDMAKKYNIAHMTINKALNGLVSAGYLERMPPRGTFVRDKQARLKSAVVVMDYRSMHAILPQPLQHAMADSGYVVTMFDLYNLNRQPKFFVEFCQQQQPDILLIEGYSIFPYGILKELPKDIPITFLHRFEHTPNIINASYILTDTHQTGSLAVEIMKNHNCKRIGVLTGQSDTKFHIDLQIAQSIEEQLLENGYPAPLIIKPEAQTTENLKKLLMKHSCDGYFGIIDGYIVPLKKMIRKLKIPASERPLLIGRGNTPWAESFDLTSFDLQPGEFIRQIRRIIASLPEPQNVKIPVVPVFRNSCPQIINETLNIV